MRGSSLPVATGAGGCARVLRALEGVQGWVDEAVGSGIAGEEMRVTGWCFFPGTEVRSVWIALGADKFECDIRRFRADVAAAHPGEINAPQSGFEAAFLPARAWEGILHVEALLADGRVVGFQSDKRLRIVERPWRHKLHRAVKRLLTPRSRIRTVCITNDLNITAGPLYLAEIVTQLKRNGIIEPTVISPRDGWLRKELEDAGIEVRIRDHMQDAASLDRSIRSLAREFAREQAEVVYANTLDSFPAIAAANQAGIPSFWNIHESHPWQDFFAQLLPPIDQQRAREIFSWPHRVMFSTEDTRHLYHQLDAGNFCVLPNAVDGRRIERAAALHSRDSSRRRLGIDNDQIMLLLLGTVCQRKGQLDLVEALTRLPDAAARRVRCFIVGDRPGSYSQSLHQKIRELPPSLRRQTTVVAETPETALYFGAADIFVCTSRIESFPRVILEAMHYGLPIVTTAVFGIRSQVEAGVNGMFYEPGDVDALRKALQELLDDAPARRRMADHSRAVLAKLGSFDQMIEGYAQVLRATRDAANGLKRPPQDSSSRSMCSRR